MNSDWLVSIQIAWRRLRGRLGLWGIVGITLLGSSVVMAAVAVHDGRELLRLQDRIARAALRPDRLDEPYVSNSSEGSFQISDRLPAAEDLPAVLVAIVQQGEKDGLLMSAASYRAAPGRPGHLPEYEMTFQVRGAYPILRHFCQDVLNTQPGVAFREFSIARATKADAEMIAHVRLVIFFRPVG